MPLSALIGAFLDNLMMGTTIKPILDEDPRIWRISCQQGYISCQRTFCDTRPMKKKAICGETLTVWQKKSQLCRELKTNQDGDDISHCISGHSRPAVGRTIWCLQIMNGCGLILPSVTDKDSYVRIGVFHLRSKDVDNAWVPLRFLSEVVQTVAIIWAILHGLITIVARKKQLLLASIREGNKLSHTN